MRFGADFEIALKKSLTNIHDFAPRFLNFEPTPQQADFLDLIQWETFAPIEETKKGIFVKSGQGPGKTGVSSVGMLFRFLQRINNRGLVTAPTRRQVEDIWVSEFAKWVSRAPVQLQQMLDIQKTRIRVRGFPKWEILTATSVKPESVQGYHHENLTVLADEASGIARRIWETLKGTISEPGNLIIGIGNPNERDTEFFDAFYKDADLYHLLTWNAEDSPNVDPKHIQRMAEEHGRESDVYRVRVLGEFPLQNPNVVIRYEDLLHACRNVRFQKAYNQIAPMETGPRRQFGIDLARFGGDESVVVARYNSAMIGMRHYVKWEPGDVIHDAFRWQRELAWENSDCTFCVDSNGLGQGVLDDFYATGRHVFEFMGHKTAMEPLKYDNMLTEAYFAFRGLTRERVLHMKENDILFKQLVGRQYYFKKGLYVIESKDEYLDRVGQEEFTSPDRAEATVLAFYPHAQGSLRIA